MTTAKRQLHLNAFLMTVGHHEAARLMYATAQQRAETRGMHKREDFPELDPDQHHRLVSSGLDTIATRRDA